VLASSAGLNQGSEFVVRLPVLADVADQRLPEPVPREPAQRRRILVVDDNRDAATSLSDLLELTGHDMRVAHDGLEAVSTAEKFRPDVVLLDIGLPKLNGYEVARKIRQEGWGERVTLVALTGWGQDEDRRKSSEAGFNAHMVKPVDPVVLMDLLDGLRSSSP
jgi:CheY-like chemotaxis protein